MLRANLPLSTGTYRASRLELHAKLVRVVQRVVIEGRQSHAKQADAFTERLHLIKQGVAYRLYLVDTRRRHSSVRLRVIC